MLPPYLDHQVQCPVSQEGLDELTTNSRSHKNVLLLGGLIQATSRPGLDLTYLRGVKGFCVLIADGPEAFEYELILLLSLGPYKNIACYRL